MLKLVACTVVNANSLVYFSFCINCVLSLGIFCLFDSILHGTFCMIQFCNHFFSLFILVHLSRTRFFNLIGQRMCQSGLLRAYVCVLSSRSGWSLARAHPLSDRRWTLLLQQSSGNKCQLHFIDLNCTLKTCQMKLV